MLEYRIIDDRYVMDYRFDKMGMLRILASDLQEAVSYIVENRICNICLEDIDPVALYKSCEEHNSAILFDARRLASEAVDLRPLLKCDHIHTLNLEGDLLHFEILGELPKLQSLSLDNRLCRRTKINIGSLTSLKTLYIQEWGKNIEGIGDLPSLRELKIWKYKPKSRDLREFVKLNKLVDLELIQCVIDNVEGIESLDSLRRIGIYYSRTLKDISALKKCAGLEKVELEHVPALAEKYNL